MSGGEAGVGAGAGSAGGAAAGTGAAGGLGRGYGSVHVHVHVEGIALWAPRLPGWDAARAILRGEAEPPGEPAPRPSPAILPPTERRRCPDSVAVALEVAQAACRHAHSGPRSLPSVFASTHGDLAITDYVCATLARTPALLSPTKFHHSVHNAAAGYWSIAAGCLEPYTALSAFEYTFAAGLLSAAVQACADDTAVLYAAYDIEARGPLATVAASRGLLAAALVLSPGRTAVSRARLEFRTAGSAGEASRARAVNAALVAHNAMAGCLPLFEALADERPGTLHFPAGPDTELVLELQPLP